jgi:hypothetical protein
VLLLFLMDAVDATAKEKEQEKLCRSEMLL